MALLPKVSVVILNYNGWQDTIECLETVLKLDYPDFNVVVVDNNSPNNSLQYLGEWAAGKRNVQVRNKALQYLVYPPEPKPLQVQIYNRQEADQVVSENNSQARLTFIQAGENGGFAAGNNIGIKFAFKQVDCKFVWLINNDTVVERDSLSKLVALKTTLTNKTGIVGSKLLYYHNPTAIQALGGKYNKWLCSTHHIGDNVADEGKDDTLQAAQADYVVGASMFVNRAFIEDVGLIKEDYFLYFEELDWILRGREKGWSFAICPSSRVYHKEGASIGTEGKERKSELADFYSIRNRILFTKRFSPLALPSVYLSLFGVIFNRLRRRQPERIKLILRAILGKSFEK